MYGMLVFTTNKNSKVEISVLSSSIAEQKTCLERSLQGM